MGRGRRGRGYPLEMEGAEEGEVRWASGRGRSTEGGRLGAVVCVCGGAEGAGMREVHWGGGVEEEEACWTSGRGRPLAAGSGTSTGRLGGAGRMMAVSWRRRPRDLG